MGILFQFRKIRLSDNKKNDCEIYLIFSGLTFFSGI